MPAPASQRAMLFVDGSNLLIAMGEALGVTLRAERATSEMIALAGAVLRQFTRNELQFGQHGPHRLLRSYWFGSVQGSEDDLLRTQLLLRDQNLEGVLFHKRKGKDEKGVDLAVAREMLMHGFNRTYETAVLVAGDEDYLGLVGDVKRLGRLAFGAFFPGKALSQRLQLSFDDFTQLSLPSEQAALIDIVRSQCNAG